MTMHLTPAENIAYTVAYTQIKGGINPGIDVTTVLLMTIDRLTGRVPNGDK